MVKAFLALISTLSRRLWLLESFLTVTLHVIPVINILMFFSSVPISHIKPDTGTGFLFFDSVNLMCIII
jgi:hypothetical protein